MEAQFINAKQIKIETKIPGDLQLGNKIEVNITNKYGEYNTYYIANYIRKEKSNNFIVNEFKLNMSSKYILPFIDIDKKNLLINYNLINCYIGHYDHSHTLGEYIYLIYRYTPSEYYSLFTSAIKKQKNFLNVIKEKDKRFDCFIFKTNPYLIKDIQLFMKGKFSSFSDEAKLKILKFHNQTDDKSELSQILNKGYLRKEYLEKKLGCTLPLDIDYDEMPKLINESW